MTIKTNFGSIRVRFDPKTAPCAVNNFISLAKQHYFDKTVCHRLTVLSNFKVLQCGDPTGTGYGTPGYEFASQVTGKEKYTAGTVAMANGGTPVSEGSQFFLVYGHTHLQPTYTVFGHFGSSGVKVIDKIARNGIVPNPEMGPQDGAPKKRVTIESVR